MITRYELCITIQDIYGNNAYDKFLDHIEDGGPVTKFETLSTINESPSNAMTYILDVETHEYIGWYKLSHIGRDLHTNIETVENLKRFIYNYKKECERYDNNN